MRLIRRRFLAWRRISAARRVAGDGSPARGLAGMTPYVALAAGFGRSGGSDITGGGVASALGAAGSTGAGGKVGNIGTPPMAPFSLFSVIVSVRSMPVLSGLPWRVLSALVGDSPSVRHAGVMSRLEEQLQQDLTASMKAREEVATSTLRMIRAAVMNASVAGAEAIELSDDQVIDVLRSEAKKRSEAAEVYAAAGRAESAAKELAEREIIERYLPAAMGDDELGAIVAEEIARAAADGATGPKGTGIVIRAVRERVGTGADGARIAAVVKASLT